MPYRPRRRPETHRPAVPIPAQPAASVSAAISSSVSVTPRRRHVVLQVRHRRRARDRQHHRRAVQQPRQRELAGDAPCCRGDLGHRAARPGQLAGGQREPRDERDVLALAVVQHVLGGAVGEVVAVLHRDDRGDPPRRLDVLDRHLGQADVPDLALALQRRRARRSGPPAAPWGRCGAAGSRSMRSTPRWRRFSSHLLAQVLGPPDRDPPPGPCRVKPTLVAITRPSGYGCRASWMRWSATNGP